MQELHHALPWLYTLAPSVTHPSTMRPTCRLAALEECSACPVAALTLEGAVPLSGATATAVDACCPHLSALCIEHDKDRHPSEWEVQLSTNAAYHLGCVQLLTLCGPRLRELRLLGVHRWQALSYMALNRCTALVSLKLQAGWLRTARGEEPACQLHIGRIMDGEVCLMGGMVSERTSSIVLRNSAECCTHLSAKVPDIQSKRFTHSSGFVDDRGIDSAARFMAWHGSSLCGVSSTGCPGAAATMHLARSRSCILILADAQPFPSCCPPNCR